MGYRWIQYLSKIPINKNLINSCQGCVEYVNPSLFIPLDFSCAMTFSDFAWLAPPLGQCLPGSLLTLACLNDLVCFHYLSLDYQLFHVLRISPELSLNELSSFLEHFCHKSSSQLFKPLWFYWLLNTASFMSISRKEKWTKLGSFIKFRHNATRKS